MVVEHIGLTESFTTGSLNTRRKVTTTQIFVPPEPFVSHSGKVSNLETGTNFSWVRFPSRETSWSLPIGRIVLPSVSVYFHPFIRSPSNSLIQRKLTKIKESNFFLILVIDFHICHFSQPSNFFLFYALRDESLRVGTVISVNPVSLRNSTPINLRRN